MPIDTKSAPRRELSFGSLDDIDVELNRIEAAHLAGTLAHSGNYTPAQAIHHLARWMERYEKKDLPTGLPIHMRIAGRLMKGRILKKGFPAGLPGPDGQRQPEPDVPLDEALAYLRRMHDVMRENDFAHQNPFMGKMTHTDCTRVHLRHSELHLGFLYPEGAPNTGN